jgi:hypothetical protein
MWPRALAVLGGLALLGSLWIPWYAHLTESLFIISRGADDTETVSLLGEVRGGGVAAWRVFTVTDVVLAAFAVLVPLIAVRWADAVRYAGVLALALVVFRLIEPPGPPIAFTLEAGAGLALAGAAVWCLPWLRLIAPLVLLASLWMPWFGAGVPDRTLEFPPASEEGPGDGGVISTTPWHVFSVIDIIVFVLALAALRRRWAALAAGPAVLGAIVLAPDGLEPRTGAFIALAAAVAATAASWRAA